MTQWMTYEIEECICADYLAGTPVKIIAQDYGYCVKTIQLTCASNNLPKRLNNWKNSISKETEEEICNQYLNGKTMFQLSKDFTISDYSISKIIHTNNLYTKEYEVNENFFNKLEEKNSLYVSGIISADGWLSKTSGTIGIGLKLADQELLEKCKIMMESNHPIYTKPPAPDKRTGKIYERCILNICRKKLHADLIKHGITPSKSNYLRIPNNIPEENLHYHLRGWADGDCGWCIDNGDLVFTLVSSCPIYLNDLKIIFEKYCDLNNNPIRDRRPKFNCYELKYGGNFQTRRIFNWLNMGSPQPRLERKFQICTNFFKWYDWYYSDEQREIRKKSKKDFKFDTTLIDMKPLDYDPTSKSLLSTNHEKYQPIIRKR